MSRRRYAVIAGGGTAGHAFLSLAVAGALVARGIEAQDIELVGAARGRDAEQVAGQGYPLTLLPGRGIVRRLRPADILANAVALAALAWATLRAFALLLRRRPRVVVSAGGYASVPAGLAGAALRRPLVLVNIDAKAGAAQRLLAPFAAASAVAFAGTGLPHPVLTGTPVRGELGGPARSAETRAAARKALGVPVPGQLVAVVGGSLGARRLNEAALALAWIFADRAGLTLYHVSGPRNLAEVEAARAGATGEGHLAYRLVPFEEDMGSLYRAADLVVCRAGALTVAELALIGVPSVLVPLPGAPGDHQSANAAALVDAGAAVMLSDRDCTGERLAPIVTGLLEDEARLEAMGRAAAALGRPDAADAVAAVVQAHAR
jgi:UDP-N-acetylglucosamine--N-acetylmuramyl-(pentapeptide) pyrophosphoryl-undecaprenol N-acetylglucosamine transferase